MEIVLSLRPIMKNRVNLVVVALLVAVFVGGLMQARPASASAATWDPTLGWDFECHTNTHPSLISLTNSQIIGELQAVNNAFIAHGYAPPQHTAYPYGDYDSRVEGIVSQYRKSGRTVSDNMMTYPVTNWYEMNAAQLVRTTSVSEIKGWIDTCIASKALLHIFTHDVSSNPSEYGCTPAILTQMLDYLVQKQNAGQLTVMTMAQAYDYWSTATAGKATVIVSFDDANESDYLVVYPLFKARGLKGTSYIVTSVIDEQDQLSWTEIAKMSARATSTITVTTPDGGQNWVRGTVHTITWTSTGSPGANVKIELLKAGVLNKVISSSTVNDGSYSWTIISTQTLGTDYKIRITSTSITSITDSSNNNFAITAGALTVTTPNGGQSWVRGTVHTITWTSIGSPGAYVKIELLKGGVLNRVISSSTVNDGSYSWTIISTQTLGTDYKIRITSTSITSITDSSNNNFAITAGALTVTTPNGGQTWARGSVHTITWTSTGSPGAYVKIELLKGGVLNRVISSSTANDGSYSWTISSTQTVGTNYKIRITSTSITSITDSSNNNFAIN
jgi:peptidoglycan/xylan/chitin deacetylase (PgdA/CDA1 family)